MGESSVNGYTKRRARAVDDIRAAFMADSIWEALEPLSHEKRVEVMFLLMGRLYQSQADHCATMPFGKYKGCPIEEVLTDRGYVEWLKTQDWIRKKHAWVCAVVEGEGK
jgi:Putative quorum-sensing-regulated virulence factor